MQKSSGRGDFDVLAFIRRIYKKFTCRPRSFVIIYPQVDYEKL